MVAHLLHDCGLDLGPKEKWDTLAYSNPDGFWEHVDFLNINDEILARFDGGWDFPPSLPENWHRSEKLQNLRDRAQNLIAQFVDKQFWGWKDPRNSLTLPFWKDIVPDLKVIHCVRSPIEVRKSLRSRGSNSGKFSLSLWDDYTNSLIINAKNSPYLVTNYHNYFISSFDETTRLLDFIGLDVPKGELENIVKVVIKPSLFNQTSTLDELLDMPDSTKDLYIQVCKEANTNLDRRLRKLEGNPASIQLTALYALEMQDRVRVLSQQVQNSQKRITEQDFQIQNFINQIAEQEQHRNVLLTQIEFKDHQLQNLTLMANELLEIQSSRSWKLVQRIRKLKSRLIPT